MKYILILILALLASIAAFDCEDYKNIGKDERAEYPAFQSKVTFVRL